MTTTRQPLPLFLLFCILSVSGCREEIQKSSPSVGLDKLEEDLDGTLQGARAYEHARYFTQFWRIAGSPSFDSCVNYVKENLSRAGFPVSASMGTNKNFGLTVLEDPPDHPIWVPQSARLELKAPEERLLLDFADTPLMLCRNSYSLDIVSPLVSVRSGNTEAAFEQRDIKGRVVLCDDPPGQVWSHAVKRGALGVISSYVPAFNSPERFPDIIAEGNIPLSDSVRSFGLKISPKIGGELRRMTEHTAVLVEIKTKTEFLKSPLRTVVAEITGDVKPQERILFIAHLDHYKPGANDNASGAATLLEMATSVARLIRSGAMPPPRRTLTFLWVDEYHGTHFWMKRHSNELRGIQAVFVLDMVGGDPAKTGGLFRIEKMPDPAVVWFRPPDLHSGWGIGTWKEEELFGSYLNDFFASVVQRRSMKTGWKTTRNVWEGGSDHDPFVQTGVPAILSWHFPDPFYHSSLDKLENLSAAEMQNAGVSVATAGLALAHGNNSGALKVLEIVLKAARERIEQMEANAVIELADAQRENLETLKTTKKQERKILEAWARWYKESFESVLGIPVEGASSALKDRIAWEVKQLQGRMDTTIVALDLE